MAAAGFLPTPLPLLPMLLLIVLLPRLPSLCFLPLSSAPALLLPPPPSRPHAHLRIHPTTMPCRSYQPHGGQQG